MGGGPEAEGSQGNGAGNFVRTTEGDDCSYEEATNCRLREETHASMMFGLNSKTTPVMLNHI
jgi:hypothetical protein